MKRNTDIITRDVADSNSIVFFPKTPEEAAFIQQSLLGMGVVWKDGDASVTEIASSLKSGLGVVGGKMVLQPKISQGEWLLADSAQFTIPYVAPDQQRIIDMFNKLGARLDQLDKKVDKIHDELFPEVSKTKPALRPQRSEP